MPPRAPLRAYPVAVRGGVNSSVPPAVEKFSVVVSAPPVMNVPADTAVHRPQWVAAVVDPVRAVTDACPPVEPVPPLADGNVDEPRAYALPVASLAPVLPGSAVCIDT